MSEDATAEDMSIEQAQIEGQTPGQGKESNGKEDYSCLLSAARDLRPQQLRAIPLLLQGMQHTDVAKAIGVTLYTVSRWLSEDECFAQEYARQKALTYDSDLQAARSTLRGQLTHDQPKVAQGAAQVLVQADVGYARASSTVTHTVILDKIAAAIQAQPADAIDAEYQALADGAAPALTDGTDDPTKH